MNNAIVTVAVKLDDNMNPVWFSKDLTCLNQQGFIPAPLNFVQGMGIPEK